MTLEELLDRLDIQVYNFDEIHSIQLKYKLQFEYEEEQGNESHYIQDEVNDIYINTKTQTITLKGK